MSDDFVKELRFWNGGHLSKEKMTKAADRIEKLEFGEEEWNRICNSYAARIDKLEAALRSIAANACCDSCREAALVARKALEGKDD